MVGYSPTLSLWFLGVILSIIHEVDDVDVSFLRMKPLEGRWSICLIGSWLIVFLVVCISWIIRCDNNLIAKQPSISTSLWCPHVPACNSGKQMQSQVGSINKIIWFVCAYNYVIDELWMYICMIAKYSRYIGISVYPYFWLYTVYLWSLHNLKI